MGRVALAGLVGAAVGLSACSSCEATRHELESVPEIPRPVRGEGELEHEGVLRSGRDMRDQDVVERFEVRAAGGYRVVRTRQEWPLGTADVEVIFEPGGAPVRVWRRTTIPDASGPLGHLDVRIYDLASSDEGVLIARRGPTGERTGTLLRGPRPTAVITAGRGSLTAWIQRAALEVGEQSREPVLDVREPLALIREVTLKREADRDMDDLGRVRVYTIYGREPFFANDDDVVVGDMFGLRDASTISSPLPDPMPDPGPFDALGLPD